MVSRVGVNLLWLVPGVVGGSEEYTLRLLRAVDHVNPADLSLRLYVQADLLEAHPDLAERFDVKVGPGFLGSKPARILAEHTWLAKQSSSDDLVHHAGGVIPLVTTAPAVLTIHDLQPLDMPQNFGPSRRRWLDFMLPRSAQKARGVLCPSAFTAGRVSELLGVGKDRLFVVHHGHEPVESGVLDHQSHAANCKRYGDFVLLPAIAYAHKRHIDAIHAIDELTNSSIPQARNLNLVMTGRPGPRTEALQNRVRQLGLQDRCHFVGRVSEADLDGLYRSAKALVFPSLYEGFGNPMLEAMARGCPVISTNVTSIPEVVGTAGLLVEPNSPHELASAIERILGDEELRRSMIDAGVDRARDFGWANAGEALLAAYRDALT